MIRYKLITLSLARKYSESLIAILFAVEICTVKAKRGVSMERRVVEL